MLSLDDVSSWEGHRPVFFGTLHNFLRFRESVIKGIEEPRLYMDAGDGCDSYLFDTGQSFTLIECNGRWMIIEKTTGQIELGPSNWRVTPPGEYVATFRRESGDRFYAREVDSSIHLDKIYKFKGP